MIGSIQRKGFGGTFSLGDTQMDIAFFVGNEKGSKKVINEKRAGEGIIFRQLLRGNALEIFGEAEDNNIIRKLR